jgi:hypothetical protein
VALLAEIRTAQEELGNRIDRRAGDAHSEQRDGKTTVPHAVQSSAPDAIAFAKKLGRTVDAGDPRATHRRPKRRYKTRVRMPSKLDPHIATIENWLVAEPQLTSLLAALFLSDFSRRCTIECCFFPNCSGYLSLSRLTIASLRRLAP